MSQNPPPIWQAHSSPDYDSRMQKRCSGLLEDIVASHARRQGILADPRDLHRELFCDFTPPGYPEYAGTYRGTPQTTLETRFAHAMSTLGQRATYSFTFPDEVSHAMDTLLSGIKDIIDADGTDYEKLLRTATTFGFFGSIHPFLDGNGHVQRAIFAAMIIELGYPLSPRFALHPRPFDAVLAILLELFTTTGQPHVEGPLLAEYLGYFVDGPFLAVRGTLEPVSIY